MKNTQDVDDKILLIAKRIITGVSRRNGLTVVFVEEGDDLCKLNGDDTYRERCCTVGDTIWVGFYKHTPSMAIGFFHELGHVLSSKRKGFIPYDHPDYKKYAEAVAWMYGLAEASKYNILFTPESLEYAAKEYKTYYKR